MVYSAGARVGFFQGDVRLLPDDMKTLQPTIFPVVPRLLNRIYDRVSPTTPDSNSQRADPNPLLTHQVQSGAKTPMKKWLLNLAVDRKYREVTEGIIRTNSIWDKLIFNKLQVTFDPGRPNAHEDDQVLNTMPLIRI